MIPNKNEYITANILTPNDSFLLLINAIDTAVKFNVNNNASKPNFKKTSTKLLNISLPSSLITIKSLLEDIMFFSLCTLFPFNQIEEKRKNKIFTNNYKSQKGHVAIIESILHSNQPSSLLCS